MLGSFIASMTVCLPAVKQKLVKLSTAKSVDIKFMSCSRHVLTLWLKGYDEH